MQVPHRNTGNSKRTKVPSYPKGKVGSVHYQNITVQRCHSGKAIIAGHLNFEKKKFQNLNKTKVNCTVQVLDLK